MEDEVGTTWRTTWRTTWGQRGGRREDDAEKTTRGRTTRRTRSEMVALEVKCVLRNVVSHWSDVRIEKGMH